jgi:putative DNA primase/helicase
MLTESWLGNEDHDLENKLRQELPGILNWALEGLHRLTVSNGNHFTVTESAEEAVTTMRDLASPVRAFVRETCELDDAYEIAVDDLYGNFRIWADNNGYVKFDKHVFGRDLRAAYPAIGRRRPRVDGDRPRFYTGVRLRSDA